MKTLENRYTFIGRKIKEARDSMRWSQRQLAEAIGFESNTAISLIEAGERRVAVDDLEKIAKVLHKNTKYFLGEQEKSNFHFALRADKNLSSEDKAKIFEFIEFIKSKKYGKRD